MTRRENSMAILSGTQPDYYGDFMDSMVLVPDLIYTRDIVARDGKPHKDSWGTTFLWEPGSPGQHPVVTDENLVIKDIESWRRDIRVPELSGLDWTRAKRLAAEVDRSEMFVGCFSAGGLFERSHHLMGFEEALVNYLLYEDEVAELLDVIADFKIRYIEAAAKAMRPDVIFYQDDWGHKTGLLLSPVLWRRLIKPREQKIVEAAHANGMLFIHHADCYCEPLAEDMVEIGVDIWQGVIPQNDILEIQRKTGGKLALIGGIDGPKIDVESAAEEDIRKEVQRAVDTYCPAGRFFPGIAYGRLYVERNFEIFKDEMEKYGREWAIAHPIIA